MQEVLLAGYKNNQLTLLISREGNWVAGGQGEQSFHCKIFLCFLNSDPCDWSPIQQMVPGLYLDSTTGPSTVLSTQCALSKCWPTELNLQIKMEVLAALTQQGGPLPWRSQLGKGQRPHRLSLPNWHKALPCLKSLSREEEPGARRYETTEIPLLQEPCAGETAGGTWREVGGHTWLWGLLAHMFSFHGPNASTKHDGLDPLTPLAVRELKAQGAGKAWNVDVTGRGHRI